MTSEGLFHDPFRIALNKHEAHSDKSEFRTFFVTPRGVSSNFCDEKLKEIEDVFS